MLMHRSSLSDKRWKSRVGKQSLGSAGKMPCGAETPLPAELTVEWHTSGHPSSQAILLYRAMKANAVLRQAQGDGASAAGP